MNDLIKTATAFLLNEDAPKNLNESVKFVSKGIFTQDGKKVDGERKSKLFLAAVDENGYVHDMNWKEWSASNLKDTSSDLAKKQFIDRLAKQIKAFNKRVDLNTWLKAGNRSFADIVNYIFKLDSNIKYPKTGLKENLELDESLTAQILLGEDTNNDIIKKYEDFLISSKNFYKAIDAEFSKRKKQSADISGKYDNNDMISFENAWTDMVEKRIIMLRKLVKAGILKSI